MRTDFVCIKDKGVYNSLSMYVYIWFSEKLNSLFLVLVLEIRKNILI